MPTITVRCDSCNTEHETSSFGVDQVCGLCPWCKIDTCEQCEDPDHSGYHPDCWQAEHAEDDAEDDIRNQHEAGE